jgi:hypothetical protein
MSTENSFIPEDYTAPTSGGGYTKIEQGENRFRILSNPLLMWTLWGGGKPTRLAYNKDKKPAMPTGENASVKHAWALIVYNYGSKKIEVLELDKMTLITPLLAHAKDKDWGHPKHYDVVFKKEGSGKDNTKYSFVAKPKSEPIEEIVEAFIATPIDLGKLLIEGGDPFISNGGETATKQPEEQKSKVITLDNWNLGEPIPEGYKVVDGKLKKDLPF